MNQQESKKLEKKVLQILNQQLQKDETVVAGISGGPDSVFLLHFLAQTEAKIIVAHLNHKLRKEADKEEEFVKKIAQGHIFKSKAVNIAEKAEKTKKGLEETGRHERYKLFKSLASRHAATHILTAHHANDNLETILLNLTRGATLRGLSGIPLTQNISTTLTLFRPLITITKEDICAYLQLHNIPYLNDPSNNDQKYSRNFIRHEIIPKLATLNPNLVKTVAQNNENLREVENFLEEKAQKWLRTNAKEKKSTLSFSAKKLLNCHPALQKQILIQAHHTLAGSTKNLETPHILEAINVIKQNVGNKKKKMGKATLHLNKGEIKLQV